MVAPCDGARGPVPALEEILSEDFSKREIAPSSKGGGLNHGHYLKTAGLATKTPEALTILEHYDALVRAAMTVTQGTIAMIDLHLDSCFSTNTILVKNGAIVRRRIGYQLGFPQYLFSVNVSINERLDEWDQKIADGQYRPNFKAIAQQDRWYVLNPPPKWSVFRVRVQSSGHGDALGERLETLLQSDYENERILVNKRGFIRRMHYAAQLGVSHGALTFHRARLEKFERLLGLKKPIEKRFPDIVKLVDAALKDGSLEIAHGEIHLTSFLQRFDLALSDLKDYTPLQDLVEKTNTTIKLTGYRVLEVSNLLAELKFALQKAELNKDGLTINRAALTRKLGLPKGQISRPPFIQEIRWEEKEVIRPRVESDRLQCIINERALDFSFLVGKGWNEVVVQQLCSSFSQAFGSKSKVDVTCLWNNFRILSGVLSNRNSQACKIVFASINAREDVPFDAWRTFVKVDLFRTVSAYSDSGQRNRSGSLNKLIATFVAPGIFPPSDERLETGKRKHRDGRPSLIEVSKWPSTTADDASPSDPYPTLLSPEEALNAFRDAPGEGYVDFAKWLLLQGAAPGSENTGEANGAFLLSLHREVSSRPTELPDDPVEGLSNLIDKRFQLLYEPAKAIVDRWRTHHEYGQEMLKKGANPGSYLSRLESARTVDQYQYKAILREYFPLEADEEGGIANVLSLAVSEHAGIILVNNWENRDFCRTRSDEYLPVDEMQAYLLPHADAVAATILLYLIESGCNLAVARSLFFDCVEPSDELGFRKVSGEKARAKGKPIVTNLPTGSPALMAIDWLKDACEPFRGLLSGGDENMLFIARIGGELQAISDAWLYNWFSRFLQGIPEIAEYAITLATLRPSKLLYHALTNDGDLRIGLAYGQHHTQTGPTYQIRPVTRYLYDQHWKVFQNRFNRTFLEQPCDLKKSSDEQAHIRTGIGGVCTVGGCEEIRCWKCRHHALVFDEQSLADYQIWNEALKLVQGEWERERVERWQEVWLGSLVFTDYVAEKLTSSEVSVALRKRWKQATALKNSIVSAPGYVYPRPF